MAHKAYKCCFILIFFIGFVSTVKLLDSIKDLVKENVDFGSTFPRHGLLLLHWLANNIDVDNNDIIYLPLNFEPERGDYGIHRYENYNNRYYNYRPLLPHAGINSYYALGNLNSENARALPPYVTRSYNARRNQESNRDRIILSIRNSQQGRVIVDQIYITQHHQGSPHYDPDNTYRITTNLLREVRSLNITNISSPWEIRQRFGREINQNDWGHIRWLQSQLGSFVLLLFICLPFPDARRICRNISPLRQVREAGANFIIQSMGATSPGHEGDNDDVLQIKLKVKTALKGTARICWSGIPDRLLQCGAVVVLFQNNDSTTQLTYEAVGHRSSGTVDTSVPLNAGLQVRLHYSKPVPWYRLFGSPVGEELVRGAEFHDANGQLPVHIKDYNGASLQLYVKDGKACVRLYIKTSFTGWKETFYYHWIGIYSFTSKGTSDYKACKWVIKLGKESRTDLEDIPDYDVYYYNSGVAIQSGFQARFMLEEKEFFSSKSHTLTCTPLWE